MAVSTDIIVGFPGETEQDFVQTLEVVEAARYDSAYTFQYSPRPGTDAAEFDDHVPKPVVQERFERLVALQERISTEKASDQVGGFVEVLVEGEDGTGRSTKSRTRTNRVVHLDDDVTPGTFADVRIVAAAPHHLRGELVATPSVAR